MFHVFIKVVSVTWIKNAKYTGMNGNTKTQYTLAKLIYSYWSHAQFTMFHYILQPSFITF